MCRKIRDCRLLASGGFIVRRIEKRHSVGVQFAGYDTFAAKRQNTCFSVPEFKFAQHIPSELSVPIWIISGTLRFSGTIVGESR